MLNKKTFWLALGLVVTPALSVSAGQSSSPQVVDVYSTGFRGVPAHARASSNSVEHIGCSVYSNGYVSCWAKEADGTYGSCSVSGNEGIWNTAANANADDMWYISHNGSGTCTSIIVSMRSYWL